MLYAQPGKWLDKPRLLLHDGRYHLFHLQGSEDGSGPVELAHAQSPDLLQWEQTPLVLPPGAPGAWDEAAITGGSAVVRDGVCSILYSATDSAGAESIGLATTTDWLTWQRHPEPVLRPDARFYKTDAASHWREPFVWLDQSGGSVYCLVSAISNGHACVALAQSRDLVNWECLTPAYVSQQDARLEHPEVFSWQDLWVMIFGSGAAGCETRCLLSDTPLHFTEQDDGQLLLGGPGSLDCALTTAETPHGRGAVHVSLQREPAEAATRQPGSHLALPKTLYGAPQHLLLTVRNDLYTAPINCLDCERLVVDQMECWRTAEDELQAISPGGRTFLPLTPRGNRTASAIIAIDGNGEGGYVIGSDEVIVALSSDGYVIARAPEIGYERRWKVAEPRGELSVILLDRHVEVYYGREFFGSLAAPRAGQKTLALFCDGTLSIVFSGVAVKQFQHESRYLPRVTSG
ncbi:MAG: hypothetical protein ACYC63_13765 [Armatimonadota bacterium]